MSATTTPHARPFLNDILSHHEDTIIALRVLIDAAVVVFGDDDRRDTCARLLGESLRQVTRLERSFADIYSTVLIRRTTP